MTLGQGLYGLPEPELPPRKPSRWRLPIRIAMGFAGFFIVSLTMLHFLGGDSPRLKETVEQYLSESSGYKVTIGKLNALVFYPLIGIDMDDVTYNSGTKGVVARLGHVNFSTSFWGVSSGQSIHSMNIREAFAEPGVFTPGKLNIDYFLIDNNKQFPKPQLHFSGQYNGQRVTMRTDLKKYTSLFNGVSYGLEDLAVFKLTAGDMSLDAQIEDAPGGRKIRIDHFTAGKKTVPVKGDVAFDFSGDALRMAGKIEAGASIIQYDLSRKNKDRVAAITGTIDSDHLDLDDVTKDGGLIDVYEAVMAFYRGPGVVEKTPYDFSQAKIDITLKAGHLFDKGAELGELSARAETKENALVLEGIKGKIKGGELEGGMTLDAKQKPALLSADFTIRQMDYTSFSAMVKAAGEKSGHADVRVAVTAHGNDDDEFWADLNGKATVIAGPGGLTSSLINLWGGGLLNTMLPTFRHDENLQLNCGIGDFVIENGKARTRTLFLDTDRVTVVGEGTINLKNTTIDMDLDPKSKNTAFLSAATAVHVSGKLEHPSIEPDALSLGKKIGGLLLGTINPVYLAFSMTDMGVEKYASVPGLYQAMKRFYKSVSVAPEEDGFSIHLDGRPVKTSSRRLLVSPSQKLADEIAAEWEAQVDIIDAKTMPLTQILTMAMDCVTADRAAIEAEILNYLNTDLLLYRAKEPEAIVRRQHEIWDPWVQRFEREGVCRLLTTKELKALVQSDAAHHYARKIMRRADTWHFTALQMVTAMSGSVILALAFIEGAATPEDVFRAAQLEELYRNELYNEDVHGKAPHQEKAQAGLIRDLNALRVFLNTV